MMNIFSGFIFFRNSAYLPLLILTAIPLLLHLFSKVKPPKLIFSSNMLLKKIVRQNEKIKKPHDLLLLIIRTLIFLFIILIFLKPIYFNQPAAINFFRPKSVVIIVDASASMAYNSSGQTAFAAACAEAAHILSGLSAEDKADIIFLKSSPEPVFPAPATNFAFLKQKLAGAAVSNEAGAVAPAVKKAIELLKNEKNRRVEIYVISDFQKRQWSDFFRNPDMPEKISFTFIKTETADPANSAVTSSEARPYTPLPGDKIIFSSEISNFSPNPKTLSVYFRTGAIYKQDKISVPSWSSSEISFALPYDTGNKSGRTSFSHPDFYSYIFSIDEDSFPGDNIRYGVIKTSTNLKVSLAGGTENHTQLKKALNSLSFLDLKNSKLDDRLLQEIPDFLFIENWHGEQVSVIKQLLKQGTAIFLFPAPGTEISALNRTAGNIFHSNSKQLTLQNAGKKPFRLHLASPNDKAFSIFAGGEYGNPADAIVKKRLLIPQPDSNAAVLLNYSDKIPALLRVTQSTSAPLYIWNIPLNIKDSNFALRMQFIPLLGELILSSRTKNKNLKHLVNYLPGAYLTFSSDNINGISGKITLQSPGKQTVALKPLNRNGREILITEKPVTEPGIYSWILKKKVIMMNRLNFPASESDLRSIPSDIINQFGTTVSAGTGETDTLQSGLDLFPLLFFLALAALFAEGFIMLRSELISDKLNREKE